MTDDPDDATLLRHFAAGDRAAFEQLVRKYINFVYATARRHVGDPHLADDVTQAVFVILTAKARRLGSGVVLVGWLYRTTAYVAANAIKTRRRRAHHERQASAERSEQAMTRSMDEAKEDAVRLDRAMLKLRSASR